ncbi:DUF3299 domain-containing protein [Phenylobacterium sp. J426]|uniref:DUF3299 domain-containing protein n=1 Tax=Phenylobacterium sp. J426 TaxID=2898439 RepID=UPI002150D808|nr:DUF3299 domain-containing protein [Phenylobacterium sp. J426]MCR5876247.1 DUF3299 domain-containing protein [Phenylobacterium sp. J426]
MLDRRALLVSSLGLVAAPAHALQRQQRPAAPTEAVWKPADTPPGGIAWSLLESTKEITRTDAKGYIRSKPVFPPKVKALDGKPVKVAGYMMPLQNGTLQKHFVLLAYPPDCPFHLNPNPMQFIEIKSTVGFGFDYRVKVLKGTLKLGGHNEEGIFYRIWDAQPA